MTAEGASFRDPAFWKGKRALVTGATGMVGSWLTRRLVDEGSHGGALVRDADPQSELIRSGTIDATTVVSGCLEDYGAAERAVNDHEVDTVFHLSAQTSGGAAHRSPLAALDANVQGTANVLEACRVHSSLVQRVVVASSDKAYGEHDDLPYREDMELIGRHPYEVSKSCADLITQAYSHTYGLPTAIARCGNIYGGGDLNWSRIVPGSVRSILLSEPLMMRSDGTFLRDYLYVEDVVDAYLVLAEAVTARGMAGEAFNFSNESPLTVMEMFEAVRRVAGREGPDPVVLGNAVGEIRDQYLSAEKARRELGWKSQFDLDEGLRRTFTWYERLLAHRFIG